MHELSLMQDLVEAVSGDACVEGAGVHVVRLVVGAGSGASPHAMRFCFELCAAGTPLEGATLEIVETGGNELRLAGLEVT